MDILIKNLFGKYIANKISSEERKALQQAVAHLSDDELSAVLSAIWQESDSETSCPDNFDELIEKLHIRPEKKTVFPWIARIAASLLIPLIASIFLLYRNNQILSKDNQHLSSYLQKEITVDVKSGDKAQLFLADGTEVFLNAASTLKYPSNFGYDKRSIYVAGEAYLKVFKDSAAPFLVHTDYLQIEVLGTEFNLSFYEGIAEATLIEGSLRLTTKGVFPQSIVLSPNQKAVYNTESERLRVIPTNTYTETAWLRGELIFRSTSFAHIMDKLKIRYGIDIEIENNRYDSDLFTGNFQADSIDKILKILQLHYKFTYKYTANDKILIKFK